MNNIIKELRKQSLEKYRYSDCDGDNNHGIRLNEEKFAKLILEKAMRSIEEQTSFSDADTEYDRGVIQGMDISIHIIAAMLV
jgi:hypothetical protein